jgi:hypothetical protein
VLAQIYRENQEELRANLAVALDVVARVDISFLEGDALDLLLGLIAESPGPLCIYHANCLIYWSDEAKARLEAQLIEASRGRELYRVSIEPDSQKMSQAGAVAIVSADIVLSHYRDGVVDSKVVAHSAGDNAIITWLD